MLMRIFMDLTIPDFVVLEQDLKLIDCRIVLAVVKLICPWVKYCEEDEEESTEVTEPSFYIDYQ